MNCVSRSSHVFFLLLFQHRESKRAKHISLQMKLCQQVMLCCCPGKKHGSSIYGTMRHVSWPPCLQSWPRCEARTAPRAFPVSHHSAAALLHFLATMRRMCLWPAKSFPIVEDCCFHSLCIVALFPRAHLGHCGQLYLDEAALVWPWGKLFPNSARFQK